MVRKHGISIALILRVVFLGIILGATGCSSGNGPFQIIPTSTYSPPTPMPLAEMVFNVAIPEETASTVYIDLLDEVTGLALNPTRYSMKQVDGTHYTAHIPIPPSSVIKYRYVLGNQPSAIEHTAAGKLVRYRMYLVGGPSTIDDVVYAWNGDAAVTSTGRIEGAIKASNTGAGIPGLMINVSGQQTFTAADGSFFIEGLPAGLHQIVVFSVDGKYSTYQQGAVVAEGSSTPALVEIEPVRTVKVTFVANPPDDMADGAVLRLIGNLYQLGNTYADLRAGMNTIAARAPVMTRQEDGRYRFEMELPVGFDLRYKYSLGDGFWNAEHDADGKFVVRQMIIPTSDVMVVDNIAPWRVPDSEPVSFTANVPEGTPTAETVSIQFNPYAWTEPIPMWRSGTSTWNYVLYSPLHMLGNVSYRYCRNDQCGVADDAATSGELSQGYPFSSSLLTQDFQDDVAMWSWLQDTNDPTAVLTTDVTRRTSSFVAGVELMNRYQPSWQPYFASAISGIHQVGANTVFFTPTWTYTSINPPVLEQSPGHDALWQDVDQWMSLTRENTLQPVLYPQINHQVTFPKWWAQAERTPAWWQSWFDRYTRFVLHHADLAQQDGVGALVLGGPDIAPALPGGVLMDGTPSGVPDDAAQRWQTLIDQIRERYNGTLLWAVEFDGQAVAVPEFIDTIDQVYMLWSAPLGKAGVSQQDMARQFGRLLDEQIKPIKDDINKPVIIAINYPSVSGSAAACAMVNNDCQSVAALNYPAPISDAKINLDEQVSIYNAALVSINQRDWINGVVSRGYYPAADLMDKSPSVRGKPAWDVLWYWYPKLTGKTE